MGRACRLRAGLLPFQSPLLRESLLVSFPPLIDMLKFSGYSPLKQGRHWQSDARRAIQGEEIAGYRELRGAGRKGRIIIIMIFARFRRVMEFLLVLTPLIISRY